MANEAQALIAEIDKLLENSGLPLEGFEDVDRLNVLTETEQIAKDFINTYHSLMNAAINARGAIRVLLDLGFPNIPVREVSQQVIADIEAQQASLAAARAMLKPLMASKVGLNSGVVVPKA